MVIEAMDLLHSGKYDGFCLISSDSDFASLAMRLRQSGIKVFGFGRSTAVSTFKQACDTFFEIESLIPQSKDQDTNPTKCDGKKLKQNTKLINAIRDSIKQALNENEEWADYGKVNHLFKTNHPDLNPQEYGYEKLIQLIQQTDLFSVTKDKEKGNLLIKQKPKNTTQKNTTTSTPIATPKYTTEQLRAEKILIDNLNNILQNNPKKTEDDWSTLSYVASQIRQIPQIDIKQYGYAKFSDLIAQIKLFELKKQNNLSLIRQKQPNTTKQKNKNQENKNQTTSNTPKKNQKQTPATQQPTTANNPSTNSKIINPDRNTAQFIIEAPAQTDIVLWRLKQDKKVRGDDDMIFYGQTHSADNTIHLTMQSDSNKNRFEFDCHLDKQPTEIDLILLTITHEFAYLIPDQLIKIDIQQEDGSTLFSKEYTINEDNIKSASLFLLLRQGSQWKFIEKHQNLKGDLRALCNTFGIDVKEDE